MAPGYNDALLTESERRWWNGDQRRRQTLLLTGWARQTRRLFSLPRQTPL